MKIVPENINEVQDFQRGKDPKSSIGIGMYRHFPSVREAMKYVADILPEILGTDEIPPNIIRSKVGFINGRYIDRISKYKDEYITWDWSPSSESWNVELFWELQERGFLNESVDFQRGKDPKKAMGLGKDSPEYIKSLDWGPMRENVMYALENTRIHKDLETLIYKGVPILIFWIDVPGTMGFLNKSWIAIMGNIGNLEIGSHPENSVSKTKEGVIQNAKNAVRRAKERYNIGESVNFERVKDPKKVMDIGHTRNWDNIQPGYVMLARKNCGFNRHGIFSQRAFYSWINVDHYLIVNSFNRRKQTIRNYRGVSEHDYVDVNTDFGINYGQKEKLEGEDLTPNRRSTSQGGNGKLKLFKEFLYILQPWQIEQILKDEREGNFYGPRYYLSIFDDES